MKKKPLTYDDIANLYDRHHGGRKARTLEMSVVMDWLESSSLVEIKNGYFYESATVR